jgi:hypothetical protein
MSVVIELQSVESLGTACYPFSCEAFVTVYYL